LRAKPTHHHRDRGRAKITGKVVRARELVRLHADKADKAGASLADALDRARDIDDRIALVIGLDLDRCVGAEDLACGAIGDERVDAREAV
jgi:hypothetical protein